MKGIDASTCNLWIARSSNLLNKGAYFLITQQILYFLARKEHEFPPARGMRSRDSDRRTVWITEKGSNGRGIIVIDGVNHQPFLCEGRAVHGNTELAPDATFCAVTGKQVRAFKCFERTFRSAD